MKKTLLLVFIHGFKGDDTTFSSFPTHLSALLTLSLPHLTVQPLLYPSFETRGDLASTVRRFTDWLTTTVIDMEVAMRTPQPTVDAGVRVVLVGHSMGGLVAAECLLALAGVGGLIDGETGSTGVEREGVREEAETVAGTKEKVAAEVDESATQMFPYIQGLLAFDTPYLGISPGVVAHGAEGHWNATKAWYDSAAGLFFAAGGQGGNAAAEKAAKDAGYRNTKPNVQAKAGSAAPPGKREQQNPQVQKVAAAEAEAEEVPPIKPGSAWTKYALYTLGASTLAAAAGTTAYLARNTLGTGLNWATSHLEFVGCLARAEELKSRVAKVVALTHDNNDSEQKPTCARAHAVGFANFYTILGAGATVGDGSLGGRRNEWSEGVLGTERTFCNVPRDIPAPPPPPSRSNGVAGGGRTKKTPASWWRAARNDLAGDEVAAHCDMFVPDRNSGYYGMSEEVRGLVVGWVERGGWDGGVEEDGSGAQGMAEGMEVD